MSNGHNLKITGWIGGKMSPCLIRLLTTDGLQRAGYKADSLMHAAQFEPKDGVYTVTNTYEGCRTLKLDAHLDRLEDSTRGAGIDRMLDRTSLRLALREMIEESGYGNVRFRVTMPRDPAPLIISIEPFVPVLSEVYEKGVCCVTIPDSARQNPTVKATEWMHDRQVLRDELPPHVYEAILLDAVGNILEGTSSNFYAILNGVLHTASEGVLAGIARQIVYEVATHILPIRNDSINVVDIDRFSEAFITSSSRGIIPVVVIDDQSVGDGVPGKTTSTLRNAYNVWVQDHLEDL